MREGGFTLVELIVVIAILGILTTIIGVGIPAYKDFIDQNQLRVETRMLVQTFLKARFDSIADGYERRVYIDEDKGRFMIEQLYHPDKVPAQVIFLSNNIGILSTTFYKEAYLHFKPIGTVMRAGHITLESPRGKCMTVVVQLGSGRIYMKEGRMDD